MIKILQVVAALGSGGVETLLHTYYECMDREQFHFDVACYSQANGVYREKYEELGCRIFALPSKRKPLRSARALFRVLREGKYDMVHVNQDDLSFLPILVARAAGVKVRIVHSHLGKYPHSLIARIATSITNPLMLRLANGYFACSEKAKEEFYPARMQDKVYVMKNGIQSSRYRFSQEEREKIRAQYGFAQEHIVIGNVARITKQKNPFFLLEVFRELYKANSNYRLMLVGDGELRGQLQDRIREYGLQDVTVLTGAWNDAYRFYSAFDIFVLPSVYEGLGISFVEAQTNGLPTFASTAVPREAGISDLIRYLPVEDSAAEWAQEILAAEGREEDPEIDGRYDISFYARGLEKEYLGLMEAYGDAAAEEPAAERKVRIAIIVADLSVGGIGEVITNYTSKLDHNRFTADIFAGKPVAEKYDTVLRQAGVRVTELPGRSENRRKYYKALYREISKGRYDVAHIHGSNAAITPELLIAKQCGIRHRIAHCHSTIPWNKMAHYLMLPVFRIIYTKAFACGEKAGCWLFGEGKYTVIRNGFVVEKFSFSAETRQRVRKELGLEDRFVIGHVGGLNTIKNQSFMIDVFEEYRKLHSNGYLLLVGDGPDREMLEAKVAASPVKDSIRLYGETDKPEELMMAMDCFLFPSKAEGLPIALLEAQMAGLPCVISDVITDEGILSDTVRKVSLERSCAEWAGELPAVPRADEDRATYDAKEAEKIRGYSIDECVKKLEKEYLKLTGAEQA